MLRRLPVRSGGELSAMRAAGRLVGNTLELLRSQATPGVELVELDRIAEDNIRSSGGVPSFHGYHGFPASICTSVNEQVLHGIPGTYQLADGDLLSIDCGAVVDGWHGDAAITVHVGESPSPADEVLTAACERALAAGIGAMRPGNRLTDIGAAVEESVTASALAAGRDYGIVTDYTGHGIGRSMHLWPNVANVGPGGRGPRLRAGVTLAVEPMLTLGTPAVSVLADGWTVVTVDGSRGAHAEHTIAVTDGEPRVLTLPDAG
jgi:methionyl aminopeptidase